MGAAEELRPLLACADCGAVLAVIRYRFNEAIPVPMPAMLRSFVTCASCAMTRMKRGEHVADRLCAMCGLPKMAGRAPQAEKCLDCAGRRQAAESNRRRAYGARAARV